MMPAVKPHRMTSLSSPIRKPGPTQPLGCRTEIRWAGSSSSLDRDPVDRVHLGRVDDADRALLAPPAEHRGDREVARRQPQLGQLGEDLDAGRVEAGLLLGLAQRAPRRGVSPGSIEPPGKDTWPGVGAHVVGPLGQQQVGPAGPRRRASAPRRGAASASSGGTNRVRSSAVIVRAAARATGCEPVGDHPPRPEVLLRRGRRRRPRLGIGAGLEVDDRAVGVDERRERAGPAMWGSGLRPVERRRCGSATQRVGRRRCSLGQLERARRAGCRGSRRRAPAPCRLARGVRREGRHLLAARPAPRTPRS